MKKKNLTQLVRIYKEARVAQIKLGESTNGIEADTAQLNLSRIHDRMHKLIKKKNFDKTDTHTAYYEAYNLEG